ncbi:MAG TPA: DUF4038 domain-containing protein [Planctomycetota bacterium]|nr:DUF4038 domain-containing protein [Planctomycetota bacterium]
MRAPQWSEIGIELTADDAVDDPYAVAVEVDFRHDDGTRIVRPAFWDGGTTWRVRFASTAGSGAWRWSARADRALDGVDGATGSVDAAAATGAPALLRMAPGGRVVERHDGTPWLMVADTPWALPWRATRDECRAYAAIRQRQGFNAALLMSFQPDLIRPRARRRGEDDCWDEAFDDLGGRRLFQLRPEYFRELDALADILHAHGIVPVWQPAFHGYGFRGGPVAGREVPAEDYARYCRYLVARYGARPAIWLVGADGTGRDATVAAGGAMVEACDAYRQPTGIHYAPHASDHEHHDAPWLDFHWCQTGHNGEHHPERVAAMWLDRPVRAIANGEPTYENIGCPGRAAGWWQGHEAWSSLFAGGTMGVVYGAGSLWQWRPTRGEAQAGWAGADGCDWRDALDFPGAAHVGRIGRILDGLSLAGAAPDHRATYGRSGLIDPGRLFLCYLEAGGTVDIIDERAPRPWRAIDLGTGDEIARGTRAAAHGRIALPDGRPTLVICAR